MHPSEVPARSWAEIDLAALQHNLATVRRCTPGAQVMAVVKANAYGHGAAAAVRTLRGQVEMFGVANVREALEVREYDSKTPVLILGPALPSERAALVRHAFIPSVSSWEEAAAFAALSTGAPVPVHLVLDTGMGRIGVWQEDFEQVAKAIHALPGVAVAGVASHLPVADEDAAFTDQQLDRFRSLAERLQEITGRRLLVHVENSAGAIAFPTKAGDLVRAGLMLYGSSPISEFQPELRPVMTWKAGISLVREVGPGRGISYGRTFITPCAMRIATLALGYADGFPRQASNQGTQVLVGGQRCHVLGRVTMDQILLDVTHVADVRAGDEAVILGRQGEEEILAAELAQKAGTIAWDIFTGVGQRVERIYRDT